MERPPNDHRTGERAGMTSAAAVPVSRIGWPPGAERGRQPAGDFEWMTGFECTTFPQTGMDELALTQHDRFWGSDILRARAAGCRIIRYGIRWHVVNPQPRQWDWTSLDGPFELLRELDMEPIVDLFHFGTPTWLEGGVLSSVFPDFQAELCREFARRYPWVRWYTPTNEPYIMAQFGGEYGHWYPFGHGPGAFVIALRNVARGLCEGWAEIRRERPDARLMVSDTCEYHHAEDEGQRPLAELRNERRFLMHELYGGRVGDDHALRPYLLEHGMQQADLWWFEENAVPLDVVGLDYYPHSEHELRSGTRGELVDVARPAAAQLGPAELAAQYWQRLGRPLVFAETGAPGDDARRSGWLEYMIREIRRARAGGVPLIGLTWWGLLDQVDWGSNLRRFDYHIDPTGLYALEWSDGRLERVPTATLESWRRYVALPIEESVGGLDRWPGDDLTEVPALWA